MAAATMTIDCETCPRRRSGCDGCLVAALDQFHDQSRDRPGHHAGEAEALDPSSPQALDRRERLVVSRLVAAGLVSAETATRARAVHEPWSEYREVAAG